jgi:aerobic-type carbon monoxide dehydrogenase small subunit (CoxS/CutS family)
MARRVVLRTDLGLTGTKYGCGEGVCGACTMSIDDKAVRSCLTQLKHVEGKSVRTIEGLAHNGALHPLQQAFIDHGALRCCQHSGVMPFPTSRLHQCGAINDAGSRSASD